MSNRGHSAAVVDGQLRHFSVSQVKTYLRCERLWYAEKVLGLKQPRKPGAEKGTTLHKQPEAYYLHGTRPTHEAFLDAMPGLPARHSELLIEHALVDPELSVDGIRMEGYSDLIVPPSCSPDGIPEIRDWKFVSSFRYTEDPANDLQMLVYGYWASQKWPGHREIRLGLHYFMADGSDFKPIVKVVPIERCESEWLDIVTPAVRGMRDLAAKSLELEQTPDKRGDACYAFGGCHLMERCGIVAKGKKDKAVRRVLADFDGK